MRSFTVGQRSSNGKTLLPIQLEGAARGALSSTLRNEVVIGLAIPALHTLTQTWFAQVSLASGRCIEITSSSTEVHAWNEYGTLNVEVLATATPVAAKMRHYSTSAFAVEGAELLVAEDDTHKVEAGLVLKADDGREIAFLAGDIPGSLSIMLPEGIGELRPQLSWDQYARQPIRELHAHTERRSLQD